MADRKKGRKEFQWEAWNLFQMASDGSTGFNVIEPLVQMALKSHDILFPRQFTCSKIIFSAMKNGRKCRIKPYLHSISSAGIETIWRQAIKSSPSITDQGGGEFYVEILTRNLHFYGLIEVQYLKVSAEHGCQNEVQSLLFCAPHSGATVAPEQLMTEGGTKSMRCCGNSAGTASASLPTLHFSLCRYNR